MVGAVDIVGQIISVVHESGIATRLETVDYSRPNIGTEPQAEGGYRYPGNLRCRQ